MRAKIPFLADACQTVRPVFICVIAIAVIALAMAMKGWQVASLLMGLIVIFIAGVLIVQVHRSITSLRGQSEAVHRAAAQAEEHYADVLKQIVTFAEGRDPYLEGHSRRVGDLARRMALRMGMGPQRAGLMGLAGELHDVGLLAIPASTLGEPRRLSAESFRCVKEHAAIGYQVLEPLASLREVLLGVRHHHERMNGTGYPDGLSGGRIPLEARILAVADTFDAMTHDRPHRQAIGPGDALSELRRCAPAGYDGECVEALADVLMTPAPKDLPPILEPAPTENA